MWPLLGVCAESKQTRIVLLTQKLQRRGVLEGVDRIVALEVDCVGLLEHVEIGESTVDEALGLLSPSDQCVSRVLHHLRLALRQLSPGARRLRAFGLEAHGCLMYSLRVSRLYRAGGDLFLGIFS